jgi:hypothetical protein
MNEYDFFYLSFFQRLTKKQKIKPVDDEVKKEISSESPANGNTNTENTKKVKFDDSVINITSKASKGLTTL